MRISMKHSILGFLLAMSSLVFAAEVSPSQIGIMVMHGKSGMPTKFVSEFASYMESKGYIVANLEMPWSKDRQYDVSVDEARKEIETTLQKLRDKGALKVFISGHSQGGLAALTFGGKQKVDGIIAIAPGGNVSNKIVQENLGSDVARAQELLLEGKGDKRETFYDYEGHKGKFAVTTSAKNYASWFDPEGAMNQRKAILAINPDIPVFYIVPTDDMKPLLRVKQIMFDLLPKNPNTVLYEPNANHTGAPNESKKAVSEWMEAIVKL